jgi:maltose O-acetyltransferase
VVQKVSIALIMNETIHPLPSTGSKLLRLLRIAKEDVEPLLSRHLFAHLAEALPSSALFRTRTAMLRAAGVKIGAHSLIQGKMRLTGKGNPCELLSIGERTLVTGGLHVDLGAAVRIGNMVRIGHDVSLLTINHAVGPAYLRAGTSFFAEIVIEDGCWLASRCTVLPGVTIGAGAIVAAGSVVTRDVPRHTLVAGVPARVVRELEEGPERAPVAMQFDSTPPLSSVR